MVCSCVIPPELEAAKGVSRAPIFNCSEVHGQVMVVPTAAAISDPFRATTRCPQTDNL